MKNNHRGFIVGDAQMAFPVRGLQLPKYPLSKKHFTSGRCKSMPAHANSSIRLHGAELSYHIPSAS